MTDMLKFLLAAISALFGGFLTALGGFLATLYQAKKARKIRMDEVIAEKIVDANTEGCQKMKYIASWLGYKTLQDVLDFILKNESWFFLNRLYLFKKFPNKWITIRNYVMEAIKLEKQLPEKASELESLKKALIKLANDANLLIINEMDVDAIEVETIQY